MNKPRPLLQTGQAPDGNARELEPLFSDAFASAWAEADPPPAGAAARLRSRLLQRLAESRAAAGAMVTSRRHRLAAVELAPGVRARTLHAGSATRAPGPGEPLRARLIEMEAGSTWAGPATGRLREWLVLQGAVRLGDERLERRDYHRAPAGSATQPVRAESAALLFLRESVPPQAAAGAPLTVRDAEAGWPDFAPGIRRRVLWQHGGQAAMLYHAQPGAAVPLHTHGHAEECLMLQGELFLDDVLLQEGDYQLAPAGTAHRITETDTGAVIYAHGDLDLKFVA